MRGEGATCGPVFTGGRALCAAPQINRSPPDGLLTSGYTKHDVDLDPVIILPDPLASRACTDDIFSQLHPLLLVSIEGLPTMYKGEDESSSALNGRLRPRKSNGSPHKSSPNKILRKSDGINTQDKPKRNCTLSKASPDKTDDLVNKSENNRIRKKMRKDMRTGQANDKNHIRPRPKCKSEVGDAETIRKMLADLPAKRHRVVNHILQNQIRKIKLDRETFHANETDDPNDEADEPTPAQAEDERKQGDDHVPRDASPSPPKKPGKRGNKVTKKKKTSRATSKITVLDEVLAGANKTVREQQLSRRNLSRDQALFIDCCELLKESHKPDLSTSENVTITSDVNRISTTSETPVAETSGTSNSEGRGERRNDGDVDSITAKIILESEEVRNLENDLIFGLKEAAANSISNTGNDNDPQPSVSEIRSDQIKVGNAITKTPVPKPQSEQLQFSEKITEEFSVSKPKKNQEPKDKLHPDVIESIDIFEDKFDKIKRKCRSQAAAAKQVKPVVEPSLSQRGRKKSDKKKGKKNSKTCHYTIPTKGALKVFDDNANDSDCGPDNVDNAGSDDAGVARQRVRRKCTVGKQNVLAESWSSESDGCPARPNSAESVISPNGRKKKSRKREGQLYATRRARQMPIKRQDVEARVAIFKRSRSRASSGSGEVSRASSSGVGTSSTANMPPGAKPLRRPSGSKARSRSTAYFWSSDGEEEQEHLQQHGWIVGDSHKKLVTMLAHAKGRKRNHDDKRHNVE
ncbi:unnamed protein product, partial [Iphiclides podalirius]